MQNRFRWLTQEQRLTAAWMIGEGLREVGFENLAAAAKSFHEFLAECVEERYRVEERAGVRSGEWN